MANYNYTIKNSYSPFSMQEMLTPLTIYKEAADKAKEELVAYADKTNKFKYLDRTLDPNDPARKIYDEYVSELDAQSKDFARNGLTMNNQRGILDLRNNYEGTIGQLYDARTRLDEEIAARNQARAKGIHMYYANENPTISDYLRGNEKSLNTYGISHEDLRKRGLETAASASSKIFSNTSIRALTDYYNEIFQSQGYHPAVVAAFKRDLSAIPELKAEVEAIMNDTGAEQNLTGMNKDMARQTVINALADGIIYKEARDIKENPNFASDYQWQNLQRQNAEQELTAMIHGLTRTDTSVPSIWKVDPNASTNNSSTSGNSGKGGKNSKANVQDWEKPRPDIMYDVSTGTRSEKLPDNIGKLISDSELKDLTSDKSTLPDDVKKQLDDLLLETQDDLGHYSFYKIEEKGKIKRIIRKHHDYDKTVRKPVKSVETSAPADSTNVKPTTVPPVAEEDEEDGNHNVLP